MKRLELGDDYHSSDTEESQPAKDESGYSDSYGEESEQIESKLGGDQASAIDDKSPL